MVVVWMLFFFRVFSFLFSVLVNLKVVYLEELYKKEKLLEFILKYIKV